MKYRAWTDTSGTIVLLNARHIIKATEHDEDTVEVTLVDGSKEYLQTNLKNFESWLTG